MSFNILFTFVLLFTVLVSVFGANCTKSATCTVSTYTTGACDKTTKVCTCESGSAPIRTGCGSKLTKPTLAQPFGYSTLVLEGKSATLTCSSPDSATLFEWTFNDVVITGTTTNTYISTPASAVGTYKCKAKFSGNSYLDSDLSDPLQIGIFPKADTTIDNGPKILLSATEVFTDKTVDISCINVPIGYDLAKVVITSDTPTTLFKSPLKIDSSNQGTSVKCELTDTQTSHADKIIGIATQLPKIVSKLTAATIIPEVSEILVYTQDAPITLKCVPSPDIPFVGDPETFSWAWFNNSKVIPDVIKQIYNLPQTEDRYTIKCQATYNKNSVESKEVIIARNNSYVTKPVIIADPTTPVVGSRLSLACGSAVDGATYSWKKDNTAIARQFEQTIQLDNLTTSDNGVYVCTVKNSMVTQISDTFNVRAGQEIVKVSMLVLGLTLLMSKVFA